MPSPERPGSGPVLRLFVREGCHLCEEAVAVIERLRGELAEFELELVDIEADQRLHAAYLERIPVAELDGSELFELIADEEALIAALGASDTF